MLSRRAHDARPQCHLKSLFSGTPANTRIIFILRMHPDLVSFGPLVQSAMSSQSDLLSQQLLSDRSEARSPPVPPVLVTQIRQQFTRLYGSWILALGLD